VDCLLQGKRIHSRNWRKKFIFEEGKVSLGTFGGPMKKVRENRMKSLSLYVKTAGGEEKKVGMEQGGRGGLPQSETYN